MIRTLVIAFGFCVSFLVFTTLVSTAYAADEQPTRVVILKVKGVDALIDKVSKLDNVEVKDQSWFVKQVRQRGIKTKGLMRRPNELRWVMQGAEVSRVVYFDADGARFSVNFIGEDGEIRREFKVDRSGDGIDEETADLILKELKDDLGLTEQPQIQDATPVETAVVEAPKAEAALESKMPATRLYGSSGLDVKIYARLNKRDLGVNGSNGAVLTYPSQFYPGGGITLVYFPSDSNSATGVRVGAMVGLASVAAAVDPGQTAESKSLMHLEGELAVDHRVLQPTRGDGDRDAVRFDFTAAARYASYSVDQGALPSVSMVSVELGASVSQRALAEGLTLGGNVMISPFGTWLSGGENYGNSPVSYGFGAGLGGNYQLSDTLGLLFHYDLRFLRTSFSGQGTQDYLEAEAFELVQGLSLGVVYGN